ncbi:MAG: HAMP domain-containing histidine kinase, partial [Chloroflexi bacterium]|nr:HAMP domain-containing histidine kinase [Chloroflexota bacterium]
MSLRARVALLAFLGVILGVGLAVGGGFYFAQRELHQEVDHFLEARARTVSEVVADPETLASVRLQGARPVIGAVAVANFDAHVQILSRQGRPLAAICEVLLPVGPAERDVARGARAAVRRNVRIAGEHHRMLTAPLTGGGAVQVARNLGETERAVSDLLRRTIPLGALVAAAVAAVAALLVRRALKPVRRLTGAADRIARTQELATAIDVRSNDEVGQLARSFNAMLEALRKSRRQQQQLVADAGHELRTPLTSIQTNIEVLQRTGDLDDPERERILEDVNAELRELGDLVGELVDLAGDGGAGDEPLSMIDLAGLAADAADRARRRTGREVISETAGAGHVRGRRGALERAVDNLVGNAAKFSPETTPIRVRTRGGRFEVHDAGPGIGAEDRPLVFERFYRARAARSASGSGLGLAIVKQIVESHGGHVFADRSPDGGAVVGFEIPQAEAGES